MFCCKITLFNRLASERLLVICKNGVYPQRGNTYMHFFITGNMSFEIKNFKNVYVSTYRNLSFIDVKNQLMIRGLKI